MTKKQIITIIYGEKFANRGETIRYYERLNKKAFINALFIYENVSHNQGRRALDEAFNYNAYRCSNYQIVEERWDAKYWFMRKDNYIPSLDQWRF